MSIPEHGGGCRIGAFCAPVPPTQEGDNIHHLRPATSPHENDVLTEVRRIGRLIAEIRQDSETLSGHLEQLG